MPDVQHTLSSQGVAHAGPSGLGNTSDDDSSGRAPGHMRHNSVPCGLGPAGKLLKRMATRSSRPKRACSIWHPPVHDCGIAYHPPQPGSSASTSLHVGIACVFVSVIIWCRDAVFRLHQCLHLSHAGLGRVEVSSVRGAMPSPTSSLHAPSSQGLSRLGNAGNPPPHPHHQAPAQGAHALNETQGTAAPSITSAEGAGPSILCNCFHRIPASKIRNICYSCGKSTWLCTGDFVPGSQ